MTTSTVWILGSGFSKALGAPLLDELFSDATNARVDAAYPIERFLPASIIATGPPEAQAARVVRELYREYGRRPDRSWANLWPDAEAFIDHLDAAAASPDGPANLHIRSLLKTNGCEAEVRDLRDAARRLIAAACCAFLHGADTSEERWQPYASWARALTEKDTIVTFNYDLVLERLGRLKVFVPGLQPPDPKYPRVFKMHGSVNWKRVESDGERTQYVLGGGDGSGDYDPEFAIHCDAKEIGIATPGPTKKLAAAELGPVWNAGLQRISSACVITFVGYRFPPSDAEARTMLLGAIQANGERHIELHIVLGPKQSDDAVRLEQLLRYTVKQARRIESEYPRDAGPTFKLSTHRLYAEDFLTVWDRTLLWPHR